MPSAAQPRAAGSPSGVWDVAAIVLFTLFSRAAFIPRIVMGPDGPDYINGMKFDSTYSVPMPGHIGSIALARFFTLFTSNPAVAFGLAGNLLGFGIALALDQPVGPVLVLTAGTITLGTFLLRRARGGPA